jgi:hypothetical protein
MAKSKHISAAEFVDAFMWRIALAVGLVSLAYASSALTFVVADSVSYYLDKVNLVLGLAAVALILPQFLKMARHKARNLSSTMEPEGFVVDAYKRAAEKAFSFTFIFLIFLDIMIENVWANLPAEFLINVIVSFSLATFSLSFFFFSRSHSDEDAEDDFESEPNS